MQKLIPLLIVALLALAGAAQAQETYSIPANAGQVATLTDILTYANIDTCQRLVSANTCTQAQACTAANAASGASCTAAQARAANARIWLNTQSGREEFVIFQIAAPRFLDLAAGLASLKATIQARAAALATQTAKDSSCTDLGLPTGCYP
jgi:hypothetical protein